MATHSGQTTVSG